MRQGIIHRVWSERLMMCLGMAANATGRESQLSKRDVDTEPEGDIRQVTAVLVSTVRNTWA